MLAFAAVIPILRGVPLNTYLRSTRIRGAGIFLAFAALCGLQRILYLFTSDGWNVVSQFGRYALGSPDKVVNTASMLFYDGLPRFFLGDYADQFVSFGLWVSAAWLLLIFGGLITATVHSDKSRALLWAVSACGMATVTLVVTNAYSYDSGWRYMWPLLFPMAFNAGYLCEYWLRAGMPSRALITVPLVLLGIGLFSNVISPRLITPKHNQFAPVIAALEANGCEYGFSFWEYAYPIDFLTEEQIILESTGLTRIGSYAERVGSARRRCYIFSRSGSASGAIIPLGLTAFWRNNNIEITEQSFEEVTLIIEHLPGPT